MKFVITGETLGVDGYKNARKENVTYIRNGSIATREKWVVDIENFDDLFELLSMTYFDAMNIESAGDSDYEYSEINLIEYDDWRDE
ncbi:MAG: hypothetical protein ACYS7Y_28975 [Planctomycetota bacterium]|jgi:hypothetical protein